MQNSLNKSVTANKKRSLQVESENSENEEDNNDGNMKKYEIVGYNKKYKNSKR